MARSMTFMRVTHSRNLEDIFCGYSFIESILCAPPPSSLYFFSLAFLLLLTIIFLMQTPHFLQEDANISFLSAFKTQATTKYLFDITTTDDVMLLPELFWFAREGGLPIVIVGGGTNCLFAFDRYEGIFIHNRLTGYSEPYEHDEKRLIRIQSGEITTMFASKLYQHYGVSTLIPWVGLPGTMGGACIGNAGCFGLEMKDLLIEATILDIDTGEKRVMKNADIHYGYRESILKGNERYFVIDMLIDISPK